MYFYMPKRNGESPVMRWLDAIAENPRDKLLYRVRRLEESGHQLRRPQADYLRDGIYELRVKWQRVNYRLLYFFHGTEAVVAHGCTKGGAVDPADIKRAIERRGRYETNAARHRWRG